MGKGKGAPEYWVSIVKPGRIIYEIDGLSEEEAKETFRACSHKLPIKTKLVARREL
jgi:large subunit ribosomal protein L16